MHNYRISQLPKAPWRVDFSCIMRFMMLLPPVFTEHFEARNDDNRAFRDECRKFLGGLKNARITPIVVFDGKRSATKEEEGARPSNSLDGTISSGEGARIGYVKNHRIDWKSQLGSV